jgi:transposase
MVRAFTAGDLETYWRIDRELRAALTEEESPAPPAQRDRLRGLGIAASGIEASGGYERGVVRALLAAGMSVRQINSFKLRQKTGTDAALTIATRFADQPHQRPRIRGAVRHRASGQASARLPPTRAPRRASGTRSIGDGLGDQP